jgi:hypothetical protein
MTLSDANDYINEIKQNYLPEPSKFYQTASEAQKFEPLIDLIEIDNACKDDPDLWLNAGDHVCIDRGKYHHDAIYIGNREVKTV